MRRRLILLVCFLCALCRAQAQGLTATISMPTTSVCQYSSAEIIFQGSGGTPPYKFTYSINNGAGQPAYSDHTGKFVLNAKTDVAETVTYTIVSIESPDGQKTDLSGISGKITVIGSPNITIGTGTSGVETREFEGKTVFRSCESQTINITFKNGGNSNGVTQYKLDWKDGSSTFTSWPAEGIDHTFSQGDHEFSYTVIRTGGDAACTAVTKKFGVYVGVKAKSGISSTSEEICLNANKPVVFTIPDSVFTNTSGTTYTFTSNDGFYAYYGNTGELPTARTIEHLFTKVSCGEDSDGFSGTTGNNSFNMSLTATNPCFSATATFFPIRVSSPPDNDLKADRTKVCLDEMITLKKLDTPTNGVETTAFECNRDPKIVWEILDEEGTEVSPAHYDILLGELGTHYGSSSVSTSWTDSKSKELRIAFNKPGKYRIKMFTGNTCGVSQREVTICVEGAVPLFSLAESNVCVGEEVTPANTTVESATPTSCFKLQYTWEVKYTPENCGSVSGYSFKSGSSATAKEPTVVFSNPGIYTFALKVTAENGACSRTSPIQQVNVAAKPWVTIHTDDVCEAPSGTALRPTATVVSCGREVATMSYQWEFPGGTPATLAAQANPAVMYGTPGEKEIRLSVSNECGTATVSNKAAIFPAPVVDDVPDKVYCNAATTGSIAFSSSSTGTVTYEWTNSNPAIGLEASGTGNIPSFTAKNSGTSPVSATITVTTKSGGCTGASKTFEITVNPAPEVTFSIGPQSICSGVQTQEVTLNSTTPGVVFVWAAVQPAGITGVEISGAGTIPVQTLSNSTNAPVRVDYVAKASTQGATACSGASFTYSVTVLPVPVVEGATTAVCSGEPFTYTPVRSIVPSNTAYTWAAPSGAGGVTGGATGSNANNISGTLTNPTNTPQTATYSITPKAGDCQGDPFTLTVTVNPVPNVPISVSTTICSGEGFSINPASEGGNVVPQGTTYTWGMPVSSPGGAITGGLEHATPQTTIHNTVLINNTALDATITYTVTPVSGAAGSCRGQSFTVPVTVKAAPSGTISGGKDVCTGASTEPVIAFSGLHGAPPYKFYYKINDGATTYDITSAGNTATVSVPTTTEGAFVYKLIRVEDSGAKSCKGEVTLSTTVNVVAQPVIITQPLETQRICPNGEPTRLIAAYQGGAGTVSYQWYKNTNDSNSGGTLVSGATESGYTPSSSDFNTPGNYYYYVGLSFTDNGCSAVTSEAAEIVVNPVSVIETQTVTICSGEAFSVLPQDGDNNVVPDGTVYVWEMPVSVPAGAITGGAVQSVWQDSIYSAVLRNSTTSNATLTYTVHPKVSSTQCEGKPFNVVVTVQAAPGAVITGGKDVCQNAPKPELIIQGENGTAPYTVEYTVNGGSPQTVVTDGTGIASILVDTDVLGRFIYELVSVTDNSSNKCNGKLSGSATVQVVDAPVFSTNPLGMQQICTNGQVDTLRASYIGGAGEPSYRWYKNTSNSNLGGTPISGTTEPWYLPPAADFSVTGTYYYFVEISFVGSGCSAIRSSAAEIVAVADPPVITLQPLSDQTACQNSIAYELKVEASGGIDGVDYAYQWFNGSNEITGATNAAYLPETGDLGVSSYTVTVSQPFIGCETTSVAAGVTVVEGPSISVQPQPFAGCEGDTAPTLSVEVVNGVGSPSIRWYKTDSGQMVDTVHIEGATGRTYTPPVEGIDTVWYLARIAFSEGDCGALFSDVAEVSISQIPVISNKETATGSGIAFTITPENGVNGDIVPAGTHYTWVVKSITPIDGITGAGDETNLQNSISQLLINTTEEVVTVVYTVTPKAGICEGTPFEIKVIVYPPIAADVRITHITCNASNDGKLEVTVEGGKPPYIISWEGPAGFTSDRASLEGLKPGTYKLTLTDQGGLPYVAFYEIIEPAPLTLSITNKVDISCDGTTRGSITISAYGGTHPSFVWTKDGEFFSNELNLINLDAGEYVVVMSDTHHCAPQTAQAAVIQPESPEIELAGMGEIACFGESASIEIFISKDRPDNGYVFEWRKTGSTSVISTEQNLTDVLAGNYTVKVTGAVCGKIKDFQLVQPDELVVRFTVTPPSCYGKKDGTITVSPEGGAAPYDAVWEDARGLYRDNLTPGDYTAMVYDANGCAKEVVIKVPEAPVFKIDPEVKPITCHGDTDAAIKLNLNGGAAPVRITLNRVSTAATQWNSLAPGDYHVHIEDGKGCTIDTLFSVINPEPLRILSTIRDANDCDEPNSGSIAATPHGGTEPYQYEWSNGAKTPEITHVPAGNHTVKVVDAHGCRADTTVIVKRPPDMGVAVVAKIQSFDCENLIGWQTTVARASGGIPPYQYEWSDKATGEKIVDGDTVRVSSNDTVLLVVTDTRGCPVFDTLAPEIPAYGIYTEMLDCNNKGYRMSVIATGNLGDKYVNAYEFSWGDGGAETVFTPIRDHQYGQSGAYEISVTITDRDVCSEPYTLKRTLVVSSPPVIEIIARGTKMQNDTFYFCKGKEVILEAIGDIEEYSWGSDTLVVTERGRYSVRGYGFPHASVDKATDRCYSVASVVGEYATKWGYKIKPLRTNLLTYKNREVELSLQEVFDHTKSVKWWIEGEWGDTNFYHGLEWTPEFPIATDREYRVCMEAENEVGCPETDCIKLYVDKNFTHVPNTFNPGEGKRFMQGWYVEIMTRNHVLVYAGEEGWDGTRKNQGKPVSPDTYFWSLRDRRQNGVRIIRGYVTIPVKL